MLRRPRTDFWQVGIVPSRLEDLTPARLAALLEDAGVATVHGEAYGLSPYLRISIASSMEHLAEACRRMAEAGAKLG